MSIHLQCPTVAHVDGTTEPPSSPRGRSEMQKWHAIMRSEPKDDSTAVLVGIWPHCEDDGNSGLPRWYFEEEDFRWAESTSSPLLPSDWWSFEAVFDCVTFWRQEDRTWMLQWVPAVGPNPIWTSLKSADWNPLDAASWKTVFDSLNDWCGRTF